MRRRRPRGRTGRLHGRDPSCSAGRDGRLHRAGGRAGRHVPSRRLHPDEGLGADRARPQGGGGDVREARRLRRRAAARLRRSQRVEERRLQADDGRRGHAAQGQRRGVGARYRPVQGCEHDRGRRRRGRDVLVRHRRYGRVPDAAADSGPRLAPLHRLDGTARADGGAAPACHSGRRHHRLRVRIDLPALRLRGDDHRDARHADPAGGRRRDEGAREAVRQARDRAAARQAVHEGRGERQTA